MPADILNPLRLLVLWLLLSCFAGAGELEQRIYHYRAETVRVIDGDTVELRIDVGFQMRWQGSARLYGIDTPEVHGQTKDAGLRAAHRLRELLAAADRTDDFDLIVRTYKPDKYGRYLVTIYANGVDLNQQLIEEGHARPYFGGTK